MLPRHAAPVNIYSRGPLTTFWDEERARADLNYGAIRRTEARSISRVGKTMPSPEKRPRD